MSQNNLHLRSNHKFLTYSNEIKRICEPLQYLHLSKFVYRKRYRDGSEIYLTGNPYWIDDYFGLGLYKSSIFEGDISCYPSGVLTWPKETTLDVFLHGQNYYNSHSGITICRNNTENCELFFFSSSFKFSQLNDSFMHELDLYYKFITYFKEKASAIIKDCESCRVKPSAFILHAEAEVYVKTLSLSTRQTQRGSFMNAIRHNDYCNVKPQLYILTPREHDCLNLLMHEHSIVKIAKTLGISHRTAEIHLSHIREKLQCRNKSELLLKVQKMIFNSSDDVVF